jgi:TIGR03009 family protein
MRTYGLVLTGVFLFVTTLAAQPPAAPALGQQPPAAPGVAQPTAPPTAPPPAAPLQLNPNDPLDRLLMQWEQAMKNIRFLTATATRRDTDRTNGTVRDWSGSAAYLAPNLVRLFLADGKNKDSWEYYLLNKALYEYKSDVTTVYIRQLPPPQPGQVAQDTQLSLLFGMQAAEAKRRYQFQLVKEDEHYFYLTVQPMFPQDKAEFTQARLVLYKANFLPRQVWFQTPNQNEVLWELPVLDLQTPVKADDFNRPPMPKGWKEQLFPLANEPPASATQPGVPPRVVRPQQ